MTLIMYLVNYTISDICHGNHSECARRLCMNYPDLNKHINRIKAGETSGRLMEALLKMYWREELSLDTPSKTVFRNPVWLRYGSRPGCVFRVVFGNPR